ncbi:MAG: HIT domain-containing protein [Pseudomonadota bacterium]
MSGDTICGVCASLVGPGQREPIFENDLWHLRHDDAPAGVPGWLLLITRRHVGGPAHFNAQEAASFGPLLCRVEKLLEETTRALRVYTAALGESWPHFHAHLIPRYANMPRDAKAWSVFDLQRAARAGEIPAADPAEVLRITETLRSRLLEIDDSVRP